MRLIEKSATRNLFESLKEEVHLDTRENAAVAATEEAFDLTDDLFLNSVEWVEEGNEAKIRFNVSAYSDEEMNRDAEILFPLDYDDGWNGNPEPKDVYEGVYELVKNWVNEHNIPEKFYESVMINTGSTTVTSDETGVTIEDNGNSITSGNGVTVSIDNEVDVLPDEEMTDVLPDEEIVDEPTDEVIEEPTEDIPTEEVPAEETDEDELTENATEDYYGTKELARQVFVSLQKSSSGEYLVMNDGNIVETITATDDNDAIAQFNEKYQKLEDCDDKPINEADGYNQSQNVEIYQNPEFDYQILDVTELSNVDTGDIRSIDMANILNGLDESLTEHFNTPNWGEINSFLTRKGTHKKTNESYSSAILELTLPRLNESVGEYKNVYMLEVYGDKSIKDCIVRNSKSQVIKEYSGKSNNPVKHFEGVILDIMNSRLINEAIEPMINEPLEDKGVNFADSKAITKDEERQEKHAKQHEDRNKEIKKMEIGKEPDQENTTGNKEEDITDTAEVEALPKAKKTKVNAEKLKVKESSQLNERQWKGTIASGSELRKALSEVEEDEEDVEKHRHILDILKKCCEEGRDLCTDEYYANGFQSVIDDIEMIYDDEELDSGSVDYELDGFYDWCDAAELWIPLSESTKLNESISNKEVGTNVYWVSAGNEVSDSGKIIKISEDNKTMTIKWSDGQVSDYPIDQADIYTEYEYDDLFNESVKLNEAEDELLDEPTVTDGSELEINDELDESGSNVAIFHRKPASVDAMRAAEQNGITVNKSNYKVIGNKELSGDEFNNFASHLSSGSYEWLKEYNDTSNSGEFKCVEVTNTDDSSYTILVDPQGYDYARFAAIKENPEGTEQEELLDEPIEEPIEEVNDEK